MRKILIVLIAFGYLLSCDKDESNIDYNKEVNAFVIEVLETLQRNNFDDFIDLYITEDELVDMYKHYGYPESYGLSKYKRNVDLPDKEWLEFKVNGGAYDCNTYKILKHEYPEVIKLSKILRLDSLAFNKEYHFNEAVFRIECEYNANDIRDRQIIFGELIRIPNKGWRLMHKTR